ncbi:MAG: magnesium transporter [Verrucomicrobiales bacterium]|nr:magnesium transporter [Verrucomicrobiales bacterium]
MATEQRQDQISDEITAALESGSVQEIIAVSEKGHPADVATGLELLDDERRDLILTSLPADTLSHLIEFLPASDVEQALDQRTEDDQRQVLEALPDDELADFIQEVSRTEAATFSNLLSADKKAALDKLLEYPENTAGGRMTTAFAKLRKNLTIGQAIQQLENQKESTEVLSRIYIVDAKNRIVGKLRLRDLTFNPPECLIKDVMITEPITVTADTDQEEAAQMMQKYDFVALPVVNKKDHLLGVITHDDAMDILEEETTEDIEKASGIGGERGDVAYLQIPVLTHFKRRFLWVLGLAFTALTSGWILHSYEKELSSAFILTLYLPMIVAAGGNTGAQSATMIIRAMALGELSTGQFFRAIWKEMRVGMLIGLVLGTCIAAQIHFFPIEQVDKGLSSLAFAGVVGFSLTIQILSSTIIGAALPLLATTARLDPAVVASPAITTLVDITGMIIYFAIASALLAI